MSVADNFFKKFNKKAELSSDSENDKPQSLRFRLSG